MNRRNFFKTAAPLGIMPLMTSGLPIRSMSATSPYWLNPCNVTDRSVVVIYLNGGNDIFNTTVPLNQFSDYASFRPDIYIPQNQLITLDNTLPTNQQLGLHPSLSGLKSLYDDGLMSVVQGVGYNLPNRSHFKALDNWLTGSGSGENYDSGWLGRFFQDRYPSYNGAPFTGESDPLGLLLNSMNGTGFHTNEEHSYEIAMSGRDNAGFYSIISSVAGDPILNMPTSEFGDMLSYIEGVGNSLNVYSQRINTTFNNGSNSNTVTYANNRLSDQLKTVARLLSGGSRTKVFMATIGGFDTHVNQVDPGSANTGDHTILLDRVSSSIKVFQDDLKAQGLDDNVLTVVFSEFGRKIVQNGSFGVDHGTLSSMFVIGKGVEGGVIGTNQDLNNQDNRGSADQSQTQYDYRQVYSTVLQDWLGAKNTSVDNVFSANNNGSYTTQKIPILNSTNIVPTNCYFTPQPLITCACMQVRLFLEGLYNSALGEMTTAVSNLSNFPNTQPYNTAPFNYAGTENITTIPTDTVDWVLLELRSANDLSQVIHRQVALLRKDGFMMQLDGTQGVSFNNVIDGDYHLAVFHRNHLGVVSSVPILLDVATYIYDFTQGDWKAYGQRQLKAIGSTYALWAGDLNGDNIINNKDFNLYQLNIGSNVGYNPADLNGDNQINAADQQLWFNNRSKLGELK